MLLLYLGGFHNPAPRNLELAVVATAPIEDSVTSALSDGFHLRTVDSRDEAVHLLQAREIAGAYIPGPDRDTVLTAPAASATTSDVVVKEFQQVALVEGKPLSIDDVVPLAQNDPVGQNSFFYMVALSVGSYATSIAIGASGVHQRFRMRIALATVAAVSIASIFLLAATTIFGLFDGHAPSTWALSLLYSMAIIFFGVGLHPLLGRFCTLTYASMFVGLNFTSSGGVFGPELQNAFFRTVNEFWIGAGFIDATKNIAYFPQLSLTHPVTLLVGWLLVGIACLALGATVERRRNDPTHALPRKESYGLSEDIEEELEENVAAA
ncbi:hypothetical protein [Corynebacterium senegalense]|uniref:hypothetical protein n=1 Tax=Corynebacterium senegalense TaxID=2080750 RepID=UPI0011C04098|nr:hypothetical protein [Corynebacterium senegalense]